MALNANVPYSYFKSETEVRDCCTTLSCYHYKNCCKQRWVINSWHTLNNDKK